MGAVTQPGWQAQGSLWPKLRRLARKPPRVPKLQLEVAAVRRSALGAAECQVGRAQPRAEARPQARPQASQRVAPKAATQVGRAQPRAEARPQARPQASQRVAPKA